MIRLEKGEAPQLLVENAAKWTAELLAETDGKRLAYRKSRYNQPPIKDAIIRETSSKCAYCESNPLHVSYGDIEHIRPKSVDLARTFEWDNLTLACDICNTRKGSREGLLDPYGCDPEVEFVFFGPMILHNNGRAIAEVTRTVLDLNRAELLAKRSERVDALINRLRQAENHPDEGERKLIIAATIDFEISRDREFAACIRAMIARLGYSS